MMKATNVVAIKDTEVPFISFEADPRVAAIFQQLGMVVKSEGSNFYTLYPTYNKFDYAYQFVLTYETEEE